MTPNFQPLRPAFAAPSPAPSAPLLLATLPYEGIANQLCGHAARYWGFSRKKIAVLAALLAYLQGHSNRVWPSEQTLANLALVSVRTVRRVKAFLRDFLNLHPVDGDDLHDGPGPHEYKGEKRSSREVDTYDLTPLIDLLPPGELEKLKNARREPNAAPAAQDIQPSASRAALVDQTGLPNPFDEPAPDLSNPNPSEVPFGHARSAAPPSLCNVSIERNAKADSEGPAVPISKKTKSAAATANKTVLGPNVARIIEGGAGRGFLALRELGVWEKVCYDIVKDRGEVWAYKLARYAKWANTVGEDGNRAGFARRTWKKFEGWPDKFEDWFDRTEKAVNQQAHLDAQARAAKATVKTAPALRPSVIENPIPPDVLALALKEAQARRPLAERGKLTIESPSVKVRARIMLLNEKQRSQGI